MAWSSKKQTTVALLTMEAEYMAISYAMCHATWLCTLLTELTFLQDGPTPINADNQSAISLLKDNVNHSHSKHIDIQHHYIRKCILADTIALHYCPTNINSADLFTKGLTRNRHQGLTTQLGVLQL